MVRAQSGEIANTVRLADNMRDIQKLYGSRGYVTAAIKTDLDFDDAAKSVTIRLEVKEGPVFTMGDLEFRGLDNSLDREASESLENPPRRCLQCELPQRIPAGGSQTTPPQP